MGGATRHVLWAPAHRWWWTALLFAVGASCFLVAPFPGFLTVVGPQADAAVFLAGSLFFTVAAALQWRDSAPSLGDPHRLDWWSSAVQLAGTLFFNATTFRALTTAIDSTSYDRLVWRPDALGSICFLVAGALAYVEVVGGLARRPPHTLEGTIVSVNLLGCVLFGISALGAYVLPATGNEVNATIANLTTALGALAFLVGAVLLLPEQVATQSAASDR